MSSDSPSPASRSGRSPRQMIAATAQFLRTSSLARSVTILLAGAILLLLLVNFSTFVLIQRTTAFNEQAEAAQAVRRNARSLLLDIEFAETAQRGYLLTGQASMLVEYERASATIPALLRNLDDVSADDAATAASLNALRRLTQEKLDEMSATLELAVQGRIGEAVRRVRSGQGQVWMTNIRAVIGEIDQRQSARIEDYSRRSQDSATVTLIVNLIAGVLIVVLAGIVVMLVRRYLTEINAARIALDTVNAGLEDTVRSRTAALTRANEEVQRFAYIVSHDLRSPLVNVMGYTSELEQAGLIIDRQISRLETLVPDLIESDAVTAVREDMPEAVGFIRASTEKMDRLINAILKLSREGRRNLTPEPLDMTAMVSRIADSVRHQTEAAGAEIVVEDMATFESDRLSVEQIMGNLIDNAVKYLDVSRPGRIVVEGRDLPGGWVEYTIADNGRGIAERDHERIFELFRRAGRQDQKGEGLGLAFVRNSVRRLGGTITVESVLGQGSTFRLKFPKRLILEETGDLM